MNTSPLPSINTTPSPSSALVLFSGGQDSTTCLAWALSHYELVETLGFTYGQRHAVELTQRPIIREKMAQISSTWAKRLGEDHTYDLSLIASISESAMTSQAEIKCMENGLPSTFVPGRNLMFLMVAAMLAYRRNIDVLVGGMCETDYSGYPDCRNDTIQATQNALNLGMAQNLRIETPLMWKNKKETWEMANELGGQALVELIRHDTHTCYIGDHQNWHEWGYGCNQCPACELRANGYKQFIQR